MRMELDSDNDPCSPLATTTLHLVFGKGELIKMAANEEIIQTMALGLAHDLSKVIKEIADKEVERNGGHDGGVSGL